MPAPTPCVNHPDAETRLACSTCGDPICTRCVRQSAVGQKCPSCARVPRSARALGKPVHYVKAVGGGFTAAVAGGAVLGLLLAQLFVGSIILSALVGFGVGRVVGWGAQGQTQPPFPHLAVGLGVLAVLVAYAVAGRGVPTSVWGLLALAAAGWFAWRGAHA